MSHILTSYTITAHYLSGGKVKLGVEATSTKNAVEKFLKEVGDEPFLGIRVEKREKKLAIKHEDNIIHLYHE